MAEIIVTDLTSPYKPALNHQIPFFDENGKWIGVVSLADLIGCIVSGDEGNMTQVGTDGKLCTPKMVSDAVTLSGYNATAGNTETFNTSQPIGAIDLDGVVITQNTTVLTPDVDYTISLGAGTSDIDVIWLKDMSDCEVVLRVTYCPTKSTDLPREGEGK